MVTFDASAHVCYLCKDYACMTSKPVCSESTEVNQQEARECHFLWCICSNIFSEFAMVSCKEGCVARRIHASL